jgi:predicted phage terminase large subunit-like protein
MILRPDVPNALLRADLTTFVMRAFTHLNPATPYAHNWHIDYLASRLEAFVRGDTRRLIINVPPRSMKSILTSIALPAWILGREPSTEIICASYGQDFADKLAQDTRNVMLAPWFQDAFSTRLIGARPPVSDLRTTAGGGRFATSIGGVLTGRGAEFIIVDDPLKPEEALSDVARNRANEWIGHTVLSRFNDKRTGRMVIIMQRLHLDDVVGHVLQRENWEVVSLPAIAEERTVIEYSNLRGAHRIVREVGDVLHPGREPLEVLDQIRTSIGSYNFSAQYQQSPVPLGGAIVKLEWFRTYLPGEVPATFDYVVQSWDTASKVSELADYSVCTTWRVTDKVAYLLDVYRKRVEFPDLRRDIQAMAKSYNADIILIEESSSGVALIQDLKREGNVAVHPMKPTGDKVMRMMQQTAYIEAGNVMIPAEAPWREQYIKELTTFPFGKHDDQVDSTSQALKWIQSGGSASGLGFYLYAMRDLREAKAQGRIR